MKFEFAIFSTLLSEQVAAGYKYDDASISRTYTMAKKVRTCKLEAAAVTLIQDCIRNLLLQICCGFLRRNRQAWRKLGICLTSWSSWSWSTKHNAICG